MDKKLRKNCNRIININTKFIIFRRIFLNTVLVGNFDLKECYLYNVEVKKNTSK
jgi:hypothetical protein